MSNVAIIGSGSWGMAIAIHLAKLNNNVKVWSFSQKEADIINVEKRCKFLPKVEELPEGILATTSFEDCIKDSEYIFHVTPSKFTRDTVPVLEKKLEDAAAERKTAEEAHRREKEQLEARIRQVESDYQNSTCWKITAPVRAAGKLLGKEKKTHE